MEALGVAANIIAVVDISYKVICSCLQYAQDVRHAKTEKSRLSEAVINLNLTLRSAQELLGGPRGERLKKSQALFSAVQNSESRLQSLNDLLSPKPTVGKNQSISAWKWPFKRNEVDTRISDLQHCSAAINLALQIDQTGVILDIDEKAALSRLPVARGASFDSHAEEHNRTCLPGTRIELLNDITNWIRDPNGKKIFWLNGMAGTGKSTISRTLAQQRFNDGDLGASFFFKKGEVDRVRLAKFVPTLARQLALNVPGVAGHVKAAIDSDSTIVQKDIKQQLRKLILEPLSKIKQSTSNTSSFVIVLDALDECEQDADIKLLINLLSKFQGNGPLDIRVFVTSRPEVPIRLGFRNIEGMCQNLVLQEIAASTIKRDIASFLRHELEETRNEFNKRRPDRPLAADWPEKSELDKLVTIAEPLFISAATICRFVSDHRRGNPRRQLESILSQTGQGQNSELGMIYEAVLKQQLDGMHGNERERILGEFQLIVGAIVTVYDPLSALSLAKILGIPLDVVDDRLDMLHSILSVPSNREMPIRFLHLSIRDYLVDPEGKGVSEFWIDQSQVHADLAKQCLRIMGNGLKKDICQLREPWRYGNRRRLGSKWIQEFIPNELRYACVYWIDHTIRNALSAQDTEKIYDFLKLHFLHWLEAMVLLSEGYSAGKKLSGLHDCAKSSENSHFKSILLFEDNLFKHLFAGPNAALLVYADLGLSSTSSKMRSTFAADIPDWFSCHTSRDSDWDKKPMFYTNDRVTSVVFSPDSKTVASASRDGNVRIWCVETGECKRTLKVNNGSETWNDTSISFSRDSKTIATDSHDGAVGIWSVETGKCHQGPWEGLGNGTKSFAFSHDSKTAFMASDAGIVRTWNLETDKSQEVQLEGRIQRVEAIAFSPDSKYVSTSSRRGVVQIWSIETGKCQQSVSLELHLKDQPFWGHMAISHDLRSVAFCTISRGIGIWSLKTGRCRQTIETHGRTNHLHFGVGDATLVTNFGVFPLIDGSSSSPPPPTPPHSDLSSTSGLAVEKRHRIVLWQGSELLQLPDECHSSEAAISGSHVVIGCITGRMVFLRFHTALLEKTSRIEEQE